MIAVDLAYLGVFFAGSLALYLKGNYHPETMMNVNGKRISTRRYLLMKKLRPGILMRIYERLVIKPIAILWVNYQIWRDPDGV